MSNEVKLRKKTQSAKSNNLSESPKAKGKDEVEKERLAPGSRVEKRSDSSLDLKTALCFLTLAVCGALAWVVIQQNERFSELENKYNLLHEKTAGLFTIEEEVLKVSEKLSSSQEHLQHALATAAMATRLQQDLAALRGVVTAIQAEENDASLALQTVNGHFLNVTELWAGRMAAVTSDLAALKAETREAHAGATQRVNEAERRARALGERLDELVDSSGRNVRALERSEDVDAQRAQAQLDWNSGQLLKLGGQVGDLARRGEELAGRLREHVPRARECEAHLPAVEEAVRSILRLGGELSGAEGRLEEVTLQVLGAEHSVLKTLGDMVTLRKEVDALGAEHSVLKTLGDMVTLRKEVDALGAEHSVLKMKQELEVVKEAVHELTMVLRESRGVEEGGGQQEALGCQGVQRAVEALGPGSLRPQLEALRRDAGQLSAWAAGSTEKRQQLRRSVAALTEAVARIEERTGAITTDVTNKVASVKTDVRRMEGLRSELESLLAQVGGLEEQALQAERTMVKRIADLLTASIDRVSALRAAAEENARAIDRLQRRIPDLAAADRQMSERLRELEGGRARLVRTVTFAADLKPKVASIKRDFAAFEPRLSDLTLRIGQLAEDLAHREQEVAELRGALAALAPLTPLDPGEQGGELAHGEQEVAELRGALAPGLQGELDSGEVTDVDDIGLRLQGLVSNALRQA